MAKGSIRKRGNKYQITVDLGRNERTGKRNRHYETFATEHEAKVALDRILREIEMGVFIKESGMTVAELLSEWLAQSERVLRPTTYYVYCRYVKLLTPLLPDVKARELKRKQAEEFLQELQTRYKTSTVRYCRRLLSTAYNYAVREELLTKNPFQGIKVSGKKRTYTVWTAEQANQFLAAMKEKGESYRGNWRYYTAFLLALRTGMRKSEILGLRWKNVDLDNGIIYVVETIHELYGQHAKYIGDPKSEASRRRIYIDDELVAHLREHKERQGELADYLITSRNGNPVHPRNLTNSMQDVIATEGLPRLRFHDLRHTHVSLMLAAGVDIKSLQERLGHSRIETMFNIYSHLIPTRQAEIANVVLEVFNSSAKR